ncbi:hypothetical protein [Brevibacterium daeguense]|nr:hypothetical protein [Brevibacterium daeguense]
MPTELNPTPIMDDGLAISTCFDRSWARITGEDLQVGAGARA